MSRPAGSHSAHVGLNLIYLVPGETGGMEVYARELVRAMRELPACPQLTAFVSREGADGQLDWLDGIETITIPVRSSRRVDWVRGEQQFLPGAARRAGVELVHSLANTAPSRGPFRRITTIHDLIHLTHPEAHFGVMGLGLRALVGLAVRRSQRLIAVSASTGRDLEQRLHVPAAKIDVVPNGVAQPPREPPAGVEEERTRLGLEGRRVVLAASAKRPHKNLGRLLEALASIAPERRPVVLLPGYPTPHEGELRDQARALGIEGDTRFLGWVGRDDLERLYALADAFVMPSLYEGFGLPVLEAMIRGVPVACSDRSSLPEVAGDAALLFDPEDVRQIADALLTLLEDRDLAERLRAAGKRRAAEFSWQRTALQTVESYERAVGRLGYDRGGRAARD